MSLHIDDTAPDFTIGTTKGDIDFHKWAEGAWVFFFSHPADYIPGLHNRNGQNCSTGWGV